MHNMGEGVSKINWFFVKEAKINLNPHLIILETSKSSYYAVISNFILLSFSAVFF